jgi:hypothetical protein
MRPESTNIGTYMWSAVAAQRLGLISRRELVARLSQSLTPPDRMDRRWETGQFFNWYDRRAGAKLARFAPAAIDSRHRLAALRLLGLLLRAERQPDPDCSGRERKPDPPPPAYTDGVVSLHAVSVPLRACCYDTVVSESVSSTIRRSPRSSRRTPVIAGTAGTFSGGRAAVGS